jgi:DNA end-binding protein Ku
VMRKKAYHGVLRANDGYLSLITLRHAGEVVEARELPHPTGRAHNQKELDMAEQLIESYTAEADLGSFKDEFRARVMELIEKKAEGKRPRLKRVPVKTEESSLADALARSLKSVKREKKVA